MKKTIFKNKTKSINFKELIILFFLVAFYLQSFAQTKPPLLLTTERENFVQNKHNTNDPAWVYFINKADIALNYAANSSGSGERSTSLALAYRITGNTLYRDKAMANFMASYINGNYNYGHSNHIRWGSRYAFMTFTWLYDDWSASDKTIIVNRFNVWADMWIKQTGYGNLDDDGDEMYNIRFGDTDHISSISEAFLMLAICLENESATTRIENNSTPLIDAIIVDSGGVVIPTSDIMFAKADWILNDIVVTEYMNGFMKGGIWSEGSGYSGGTVQHWMKAFTINKEIRNIPFPNNYFEDLAKATIHSTFPRYNGTYQYGDVEQVASNGDYVRPLTNHRHEMMLHLFAMQTDSNIKGLIQNWMNTAIAEDSSAAYTRTGLLPLLFENLNAPAISPETLEMNTTFTAEGKGFVASRTDWSENASVLYFLNNRMHADHDQQDALSFHIIHKNAVVTKELTGYGYASNPNSPALISRGHNTLLIQNESPDGSSNPILRAQGDGINRVIASTTDYTFIEADATQVYNRGAGYQPDIYADYVVRKLAFMKNINIVVVYDEIAIKETAGTRWTKYIQHFQEEPILVNGVYSASRDGSRFFVKPMYPQNAIVTKVDETVFWADCEIPPNRTDNAECPLNQKKWHLSITDPNSPNNVSYLNILFFDDDTVTTMPTTQLIHNDTSNTTTDNIIGSHITGTNEDVVVLFNNDPSETLLQTQINYSYNTNNTNSTHYVYGVDSNTGYSISSTTSNTLVTVIATPGGSIIPSSDGVLSFTLPNNTASVNDPEFDNSIYIHPNPTHNTFTITIHDDTFMSAVIFNKLGQKIKETTSNYIDISDFNSGVYFIKINTQNGKTSIKKMIKK